MSPRSTDKLGVSPGVRCRGRLPLTTAAAALAALVGGSPAEARPLPHPAGSLSGVLNIRWGDPQDGQAARTDWSLTTADGFTVPLAVPPVVVQAAGGTTALFGSTVSVTATGGTARTARPTAASVASLEPVRTNTQVTGSSSGRAVLGPQAYITLPCAFPDIAERPRDRTYFEGMYGDQTGRIGDYWRVQSYGAMDTDGSAAQGWAVLPRKRAAYVAGTSADLDALFRDCTSAHDGAVDFSRAGRPFRGINMMFNGDIGCCAWGGGTSAVLDGVDKTWSVTWQAPSAWRNLSVLEHEMGHSLGLPHSNNSDRDNNPYDSPWDVMSGPEAGNVRDALYGLRGQHTVSHHQDLLGWIPASRRHVAGTGTARTVRVDPLGAARTTDYRMVRIPVPGEPNRSYTVEVRERSGPYDGALPVLAPRERAVIISSVDTTRSEPSWVVDRRRPASDTANTEGVVWRSGETWTSPDGRFTVGVGAPTDTGLEVTVTSR